MVQAFIPHLEQHRNLSSIRSSTASGTTLLLWHCTQSCQIQCFMCEQKWGEGGRKMGVERVGNWITKGMEAREMGENFATLHNVSQLKKHRGALQQKEQEQGVRDTGTEKFRPPCSPSHAHKWPMRYGFVHASTKAIICKALFYPFTGFEFLL